MPIDNKALARRWFDEVWNNRRKEVIYELSDPNVVTYGLAEGQKATGVAEFLPFYERLGWRKFPGELLVAQRQTTVPFTFNLPMTIPVRLQEPLIGTIDLLGPPW